MFGKLKLYSLLIFLFFPVSGRADTSDFTLGLVLDSRFSWYEEAFLCLNETTGEPLQNRYFIAYQPSAEVLRIVDNCSVTASKPHGYRQFDFDLSGSSIALQYANEFNAATSIYHEVQLFPFAKSSGIYRTHNIQGGLSRRNNYSAVIQLARSEFHHQEHQFSLGIMPARQPDAMPAGYIPLGVGNIDADYPIPIYGTARETGASSAIADVDLLTFNDRDFRFRYLTPVWAGSRLAVDLGYYHPIWRPSKREQTQHELALSLAYSYHYAPIDSDWQVKTGLTLSNRYYLKTGKPKADFNLNPVSMLLGLTVRYQDIEVGGGFKYEDQIINRYTGEICRIQPWIKLRDICGPSFAFQLSSGFTFRSVRFVTGMAMGFNPRMIKRDLAADYTVPSAGAVRIPASSFGTDVKFRLGFAAEKDFLTAITAYGDINFVYDVPAVQDDSGGTTAAWALAMLFGVKFYY